MRKKSPSTISAQTILNKTIKVETKVAMSFYHSKVSFKEKNYIELSRLPRWELELIDYKLLT